MSTAFWTLTVDPAAAYEGTAIERAELSLNSGPILVQQEGVNFGEAAIEAYMAQEKYGNAPVSYRVPNRTVTIPLGIGMKGTVAEAQEARRHLEQKVGLLQREGGVLLREREGNATFLDVVTAKLLIPDKFGASIGVEPNVILTLECLPDFWGAQETLDTIKGTGTVVSVLKSGEATAVLAGDLDARAQVEVSTPTKGQTSLLYGVRSRYYDSAETAKLIYEPGKLTPANGAEAASSEIVYTPNTALNNMWAPILITDIAASKAPLTHLGNYRVLARIDAGPGQKFRLVWSTDDSATPTENEAVSFPRRETLLVDLGVISLARTPVGERYWRGTIQTFNSGLEGLYEVKVLELLLQPLAEVAGLLEAGAGAGAQSLTSSCDHWSTVEEIGAGAVWVNRTAAANGGIEYASVKPEYASKRLKITKRAEALPGLTIEGIEIAGELQIVGAAAPVLLHVALLKEGTIVGPLYTSRPSGYSAGPLVGTSTYLWGTTWTAAQLGAATSGFEFWCETQKETGVTVYVKDLLMTVYGSLTSGFAVTKDRVIFPGKKVALRFDNMLREDEKSGGYVPVATQYGDLLRLPPSGMEQQPVEIMLRSSRGRLLTPTQEGEEDTGLDGLTVEPSYWPSYIGRI